MKVVPHKMNTTREIYKPGLAPRQVPEITVPVLEILLDFTAKTKVTIWSLYHVMKSMTVQYVCWCYGTHTRRNVDIDSVKDVFSGGSGKGKITLKTSSYDRSEHLAPSQSHILGPFEQAGINLFPVQKGP